MIGINNFRRSISKSRHFSAVSFCACLVAIIGLNAACSSTAFAQGRYKKDPVDAQAKNFSAAARRCVNNPGIYASERNNIMRFFKNYYLPMMTDPDPQGLGKIGKLHTDLFRLYIWPADNQKMQNDLSLLIVEFAKGKLANPQYHPAVRINAVMMLGKVDAQYAVEGGANPRTPKPLPEATDLLIKIVQLTKSNPRITPALCSAALQGLERHARFHDGLPAEQVDALKKTLNVIVNLKAPLTEMDEEVHFWIQRQAASALASIGDPGTNGKVVSYILALASNKNMSLDERCITAGLLKNITTEGSGINGSKFAKPIVQLAAKVGMVAKEDAEEIQENSRRGRRMTDDEEGLKRHQLYARLLDIQAALNAIKPIAGPGNESIIVDVMTSIIPVREIVKTDEQGDIELLLAVREMEKNLSRAAATFDTKPEAPVEDEFQAALN